MSDQLPAASRRRFLGWAGKFGIAAVGAIAGATAMQGRAKADVHATYTFYCCSLALPPNGCPGSGANFYCTRGTRRTWECCRSDGRVVFCGECTGGSSCHSGPYYCSEGWVSGALC